MSKVFFRRNNYNDKDQIVLDFLYDLRNLDNIEPIIIK